MWHPAPIALPAPALSRLWFARFLAGDGLPEHFRPLLRALAPAEYAALAEPTPFNCYKALLKWLTHADRLPIAYYALDALLEVEAQMRAGQIATPDEYMDDWGEHEGVWWTDTIPVDMFGVDYDDMPGETSPAKALVLAELYAEAYGVKVNLFEALEPHRDLLQMLTPMIGGAPMYYQPPRGRAFVKPWDGLPDLCGWMGNGTMNSFCDISDVDVGTGDVEMPPWTLGDVQSLMRQWQEAQQIMGRANALARHIDQNPRARLPLLHGVLHRDRVAIEQVTVRKQVSKQAHAKTLIEVLT